MPIHTDKKELHLGELSLRRIVAYALDNGASDILLKVSRPPAIRIEGVLRFTEIHELTESDIMRFLDEIMTPQQKQCFLETGDADFALSIPDLGRFRVNCYRQRGMALLTFLARAHGSLRPTNGVSDPHSLVSASPGVCPTVRTVGRGCNRSMTARL